MGSSGAALGVVAHAGLDISEIQLLRVICAPVRDPNTFIVSPGWSWKASSLWCVISVPYGLSGRESHKACTLAIASVHQNAIAVGVFCTHLSYVSAMHDTAPRE